MTYNSGKELIRLYNNIVADVNGLHEIEKANYFKERLTEAQLEEERRIALAKGELRGELRCELRGELKGREEGIINTKKELALMMRSDGEPEEKIVRYTGYTFKDMVGWK